MKSFVMLAALLASVSSFAASVFETSAICLSLDESKKVEFLLNVIDETVMVHEGANVRITLASGEKAQGTIKSLSNGPKATKFDIVSSPEGQFSINGLETADKVTYTLLEGETKTALKCSNSPLTILAY